MAEPTIDTVFDKLDRWRGLPKYQLERRADIFFAIFLTDVLEKRFNKKFEPLVIPEFPLRLGTLWPEKKKGTNQSVNVDYVAFASDYKEVFFIELKTSMTSRNADQDDYLKKASALKFAEILKGVPLIKKATKERKKYDHLLQMLSIVPENKVEAMPKIIYIQPSCGDKDSQADATCISFEFFAEVVEGRGSVGNRFAQSLKSWAED